MIRSLLLLVSAALAAQSAPPRAELESRLAGWDGAKAPAAGLVDELPLFAAAPPPTAPPRESAVEKRLAQVVADELTPRDALALVYELKSLLGARQS